MKKHFLGLGTGARRAVLLLALAGLGPAAHAQLFAPKTDYPTGAGPVGVALGDVNGDTRPDLVTANSGTNTNTVSVLLGTGAGVFGPKADYPTGLNPTSVALGDVNGDGRPDIVTANSDRNTNTVSVLLGAGAGVFGPKTDFPTGMQPASVVLGDVNGDGRPDIVTANSGSNSVSVLLNTGTGAFGPPTGFPIGGAGSSVALGDVNGDGRPDLAAVNNNIGTVSVLLGTGAGVFGPKTDYPTSATPFGVALGDVNGDGRPDIVTANVFTNSVSVLLGTGAGAFAPPTNSPAGAGALAVALGDVNGDGRPDIVTANGGFNTNAVSVLLGTGAGAFGPKTDYPAGSSTFSVALGDVNGDGRLDIVTANTSVNTVSVLLNVGTFLGARGGLAAAGGGLYPNPATPAGFTVLLPAGAGAAGAAVRLELVNTRGQVVRRQAAAVPAAGAGLAVEAAGLAAGVYALRLHVGGRVLTQRLVLQ